MSSGFKSTFTKEESGSAGGDDQLEYDDGASYFFAATVLLVIGLPYYWFLFRKLVMPPSFERPKKSADGAEIQYCRTAAMEAAARARQAELREAGRKVGCGLILQLLFAGVLLYATGVATSHAWQVETLQGFDPFDILGVGYQDDDKTIKKAYRQLSLKWHPDKNPNNPAASAKFIQITKAYAALTDEAAKANFEKYGNPDGAGQMKMGLGLPSFLLKQENQVGTLSVFFLVFFILMPTGALVWIQRSRQYAPNGMLQESVQMLVHFIGPETRTKQFPELLAATAESRAQSMHPLDRKVMPALHQVVVDPVKPRFVRPPVLVRNRVLLLAHLQRQHGLMAEHLRKDLTTLLRTSILVTKSMIDMAIGRSMNPHADATVRADWFVTTQCCIDFRRCLIQALDVGGGVELLQVPHFDFQTLKEVSRGKKKAATLRDWVEQPKADRKGLVGMQPAQLHEIDLFLAHVPKVEFEIKAFCEDEEDIRAGDVITLSYTMTRLHLQEGQACGPVHAPWFPEVFEEWYLFLTFAPDPKSAPKLICVDRVKTQDRVSTGKMHFHAPRPGNYTFKVEALCDAYAGLDQSLEVSVNVLEEGDRPVFLHPDDKDLDKVQSLFQQMLGEPQADSGSDDEDEPEKKKPEKKESSSSDSDSE